MEKCGFSLTKKELKKSIYMDFNNNSVWHIFRHQYRDCIHKLKLNKHRCINWNINCSNLCEYWYPNVNGLYKLFIKLVCVKSRTI